ncbi:MAG TPA: methyltransferase domain-containing protein [Rhizomicrobium sp.]
MPLDVRNLTAFYETPLGQVARRIIQRPLRQCWPDVRGRRLLGYGFVLPYLKAFAGEAERVIAAMPAQAGVMAWPGDKNRAVLVEEDAFPFPDAFFDRILVVHGMEGAEALRPLLRQLWRVLAPEGKLLLVAPNRASLWAQVERSPFAHGRPFSRGELDGLLREAQFIPGEWRRALYAPPLLGRGFLRDGANWERLGGRFWPGLAGVHIVQASKSLYAATPVKPQPSGANLVPA